MRNHCVPNYCDLNVNSQFAIIIINPVYGIKELATASYFVRISTVVFTWCLFLVDVFDIAWRRLPGHFNRSEILRSLVSYYL